jgi:hypothetical protein
MIPLLGNLIFTTPLVLGALVLLPGIWFLLRITPPPPRLIDFPGTRFLMDLAPDVQSPAKTPWWILLLRLLIATLVIIALAGPVHNPAQSSLNSANIRLIISNGWSAAQSWSLQMNAANDLLSEAARNNRNIIVFTTAPAPGQKHPERFGPLPASEALGVIKGLSPRPWNDSMAALSKLLADDKIQADTIWLADGLESEGMNDTIAALSKMGRLKIMRPDDSNLPVAIIPPETASIDMQADILLPDRFPAGTPLTVQALARDGRILDSKRILSPKSQNTTNVTFEIPEIFRNEISQLKISGKRGSGAVYLLDDRYQKRTVGVLAPAEDPDAAPLVEASYYIRRALEPYAALHFGNLTDILEHKPSVIIMPDIATLPTDSLNKLESWVKDGGMVVRFAGPNMAQSQSSPYLLPVPVRTGGRSTDGSLSWEKPPTLKPFPKESPFFGLAISPDITINQQILAQPSEDLPMRTWAMLEDGTPLITGAPKDKGLLVFIHTAATPDWSSLPVSGLFVDILRRLVAISGKPDITAQNTEGYLEPLMVLDGFGVLTKPDSSVKPIEATTEKTLPISSDSPPGFYGRGGLQITMNTGDSLKSLKTLLTVPDGGRLDFYGKTNELDLQPYFLFAALALLLLDGLILIVMAMTKFSWRTSAISAIAIVMILGASSPTNAQDQSKEIQYADGLYLAYIKSGDSKIDNTAQAGLEGLAKALKRRTSVEPDGVIGLDPETDSLLFFPLIYWPVAESASALSSKATEKVQAYLDHGGTILFDTRERNAAAGQLGQTGLATTLQNIIGNLNIPALEPIPETHVLGRSFYLLNSFPGLYSGGTLWVESASIAGRDGVSSVIIGSHDWASAWAGAEDTTPSYGMRRASARQGEMATRFGINIMMYALTGNYKADQVHVPFILERLGQ